jgi:hypothetical protein
MRKSFSYVAKVWRNVGRKFGKKPLWGMATISGRGSFALMSRMFEEMYRGVVSFRGLMAAAIFLVRKRNSLPCHSHMFLAGIHWRG